MKLTENQKNIFARLLTEKIKTLRSELEEAERLYAELAVEDKDENVDTVNPPPPFLKG